VPHGEEEDASHEEPIRKSGPPTRREAGDAPAGRAPQAERDRRREEGRTRRCSRRTPAPRCSGAPTRSGRARP